MSNPVVKTAMRTTHGETSPRPTPWLRAMCWLGLLGLHGIGVGFYLGSRTVYRRLYRTGIAFHLRANSIAIAESEYLKIALVHEIVAAVHGVYILLMVGGSLQSRSISIEFAHFTSIPDVILRLHPGLLSFSRCPIASLPAELLAGATLRDLFMTYTALQELPRNVANPPAAQLNSLFLEGTNVSTFWSWLDPLVEQSLFLHLKVFNAHATPYCRELQELQRGTRQRFSAVDRDGPALASIMDVSTPQRLADAAATVTCWSDFQTLFPLAMQDALSALR